MNRVTTGSKNGGLRRAIAGAALAALLISACAADDDATEATGEPATEEAAATDTGVLPTVSGGQIDINSLEGTDTILWFWAPW